MQRTPSEPTRSIDATRLHNIQIVDAMDASHDAAVGASILEPPRSEGEIGWLQHYRVLRKLGHGGMGIVYLAEDDHLRRQVALKVMHQCLVSDPAARRRFLREARAMAAVQHPHVATVFNVGVISNHYHKEMPYLAMQFLEGETLQDRLLRQPAFTFAEVLRIGREIAEGLGAAHAKGLVHRDVKPTNIWLVRPHDSVKILDFGLAQLLECTSTISSLGQIIGTLHFMSPEQALGDNVDARSDLFSLGCVLYSMLARKLPFEAPTPSEVLNKLVEKEPVALKDCVPGLPLALGDLVHALLSKSPEDRPVDAAMVQAALAKIEAENQGQVETCLATTQHVSSLSTALPLANPPTSAAASWATVSSSLRDWPSFRIALRYRQDSFMRRRKFLFWGVVAAGAGISAAMFLIGRETGKRRPPSTSSGTNKTSP
jgi:serine/threonine protein kinase